MVKKIEISQHAKYTCSFCGKVRGLQKIFKNHIVIDLGLPRMAWEQWCYMTTKPGENISCWDQGNSLLFSSINIS
uniref:Uncharacterized protein n=1 Tax=Cyanoderma ruficeps TaxID=181631 RepID=A0A8C3XGE2_9PASS